MAKSNSDSSVNKKNTKSLPDTYLQQISVLKSMSVDGQTLKVLQISEIVERSGLSDEKEVLRNLYILEGQKLVSPQPVGDFTSRMWAITSEGVRALKVINKSKMPQ